MKRKIIRLGISSCLLGEPVRYDGGHRRNSYIVDILSRNFEFVSICPEMAIGMGVPRPRIQLVAWERTDIRAMGVEKRELDVTEALMEFARITAGKLNNISGYILKSGSPSCGNKVQIHTRTGEPIDEGTGIFACVLMETHPLLPVEEEKLLNDLSSRKNFLERVFAYDRWMSLIKKGITIARLVEFHTQNRLLLLARSHDAHDRLEELVSNVRGEPLGGVVRAYGHEFMNTLNQVHHVVRNPYFE